MSFILLQQLAAGFIVLNLTIGYGVAPVLFSQLPSQTAGEIMAVLLSAIYWVDSVVLLLMLVISRNKFSLKRESMLIISFVAVGLNLGLISPIMAELKHMTVDTLSVMGMNFAAWHGVSQLLFLTAWLSILVWIRLSIGRYARNNVPT